MFAAVLYTQWKWTRFPLLILALASFTLPLLAWQQMDPSGAAWNSQSLLAGLETLGVFFPLLASAIGLVLGLAAWAADHRGRHVYALSLPTPRWHYALLRFSAGSVLLLIPAAALGLGAIVATLATKLPPGFHAYPLALTVRFGLAAFLAYGLFFAVSAGTSRTAGYLLGALALVVLLQVGAGVFDLKVKILETVLYQIYIWPGPLEVFVGRWMLFDV